VISVKRKPHRDFSQAAFLFREGYLFLFLEKLPSAKTCKADQAGAEE
jgi:hypothetical protein